METTANTSDNIITRSYEEYYQVILTYITYRITHRYEAEDLTQDVFVRLLDYKQMLRPDTVKYFLFTIARNIVIDYIRRYYGEVAQQSPRVFSAPESALCFEESHEEIDMDPMKRQETLELVKAYYRIPNRKAAKYLFDLIVTMSKTTSDRGQDSDEE